MTADLTNERACVAFLPWHSGDGYGYGGGAVLTIGSVAIACGEGREAVAVAKELARRWNAAIAAGEIKPEGE